MWTRRKSPRSVTSSKCTTSAASSKKLQHANIIAFISCIHAVESVYICVDFAGNLNLNTIIQQSGYLSSGQTQCYLRQIADALAYCHSCGVAHRDTKPENIVVSEDNKATLVDFGLAIELTGVEIDNLVGTMPFISPEAMLGKYEASAADIWSLGITVIEMLAGRQAFCLALNWNEQTAPSRRAAVDSVAFFNQSDAIEVLLAPTMGTDMPKLLVEMLRKMLNLLPSMRLSAAEVSTCIWTEDEFRKPSTENNAVV